MNNITAIIVDDERNASELIQSQIERFFPAIEVLATCNASTEAPELISELNPQLVFLDIEMPIMNGFDVLVVGLELLNPMAGVLPVPPVVVEGIVLEFRVATVALLVLVLVVVVVVPLLLLITKNKVALSTTP